MHHRVADAPRECRALLFDRVYRRRRARCRAPPRPWSGHACAERPDPKFDLRAASRGRYMRIHPMSIHPRMSASISVQYAARVAAGKIERDSAQEAVVADLARLEKRIAAHRLARKSSSLGWLFGARARETEDIKGLYIFGEVGRGKTMLMDVFFAASPVARKRR